MKSRPSAATTRIVARMSPVLTMRLGNRRALSSPKLRPSAIMNGIKMLSTPPRTASGRRVYGPPEKRLLTFIRRSRELGFMLEENSRVACLGRAGARFVRRRAHDHRCASGDRP